jgi:2-iminobutanoate/2-iminopropanoate deaminase
MRFPTVLVSLPLLISSLACASGAKPVLEYKAGPQPGPFSPAVRVGNLVFLAGQIGTDSSGAVVQGGIRPETRRVMEKIKAEVERNGSDMNHVAKCTAFLADMSEWAAMNEVYVTFFPGPKPARSAFGTTGLARGARVEIECIAVVT